MNEPNLHSAAEISLLRVHNGWIAFDKSKHAWDGERFVFESTESLQKQLAILLGNSAWKVKPAKP